MTHSLLLDGQVMPAATNHAKVHEQEIKMNDIPPEDLKYEPYPPRNQGGQHVGYPTGLRVEHVPTGLVVIVDVGRCQHRNRQVAIDMIMGGLTSPHLK